MKLARNRRRLEDVNRCAQRFELTTNHDDRISTGALKLLGLPRQSGGQPTSVAAAPHEVAVL